MPLDPNIILSGLQQQRGVDMNALVQQQISGMENINALERQRRADDLAMQDRAAKAQKEQEAAAIKALLPAYTYGIQTGDIAGAGNLVPPEMRDQLQPFIDALAGASPQEVQSALIGSLASSPEGQEALGAIQRAQTYGVQARQAKTAEDRLAFDVAEAGKPEPVDWKIEETDQGLMWVNPRTREVVPIQPPGGAGEIPAPRVDAEGTATGAETPLPSTTLKRPPKPEKEGDFTEAEAKSVNFAPRMIFSDKIVNDLETEGTVTTDAVSNFFTGLVSSLPLAAGSNLAVQLESAFNAASPTMSPEEQRLANAQLDFITAILRSESGAEIKTSEFPAEYRKYFAVEGDENNTKLLADKRRRRKLAIEGMKARAGKQGRAEIDRIATELIAGDAGAGTPAVPGATLEGFEYQGEEE